MSVKAEVICDSISPVGHRLITVQTHAPKFLDAELRTHRMLSQNSSSDRAIPVSTNQEMFTPTDVRRAGKGMQNDQPVSADVLADFTATHKHLFNSASLAALSFKDVIHKQHLNRWLLPFSFQDKVITGNIEWWEYFLSLRDTDAADPAMAQLAGCIRDAIQGSVPRPVAYFEWHLPYVLPTEIEIFSSSKCALLSAARCARISYMKHGTTKVDDVIDESFAKRLISDRHLTPFEHQAYPGSYNSEPGITAVRVDGELLSGNFHGWIQHRQVM